jgi:lipid-A-disaccharide synthase
VIILIVAGDPSGDLHAANLVAALKAAAPGIRVSAVGGAHLRAIADEFLEDLASRGVTGFWEPIMKIGFLFDLYVHIKRFLEMRRPDALVCVDYYGFNRRVLALARKAGIPAYYFVSPQVWASRPSRVRVLKSLVKKMLVIFPFEERIYRDAEVPCTFIGHPLLDLLPEPKPIRDLRPPLSVGLLPGSRQGELSRHLPIMIAAFAQFRRHFGLDPEPRLPRRSSLMQ